MRVIDDGKKNMLLCMKKVHDWVVKKGGDWVVKKMMFE